MSEWYLLRHGDSIGVYLGFASVVALSVVVAIKTLYQSSLSYKIKHHIKGSCVGEALLCDNMNPLGDCPAGRACIVTIQKEAVKIEITAIGERNRILLIPYDKLLKFGFADGVSLQKDATAMDLPDDIFIEYKAEDGSVQKIHLSEQHPIFKRRNYKVFLQTDILDYVRERIAEASATTDGE